MSGVQPNPHLLSGEHSTDKHKPRKARKEPIHDLTTARARQHDQELKRSRGEIACLECNRLKLRCDKKIPCSACVRRGCVTRCPNGVPSAHPPSKYVLLDSESLTAKADEMADRIRQLEDALAISQSMVSSSSHPLLEVFPESKVPPTRDNIVVPLDQEARAKDKIVHNFGMLIISDSGAARFTGRSGTEETLLANALNHISTSDVQTVFPHSDPTFEVPPPIWPFTCTQPEAVDRLRLLLPTKEETLKICSRYLEQSSWHVRWIKRQQFHEEVIPLVYGEPFPQHITPPKGTTEVAHTYALFFMTLAHSFVEEVHDTPDNGNADKFHQCAKCLINIESIAESPSLTTVQALGMMGVFLLYHHNPNLELGRTLLNLVNTMSVTIGLHRDPAVWDLDHRIMERRREIFWQLQSALNWLSIVSGRPGPCPLQFADCNFPKEEGEVDSQGTDVSYFWLWRYSFIKEILHPIHELICSAGALKYSDVVLLDRKVREFDLPRALKPSATDEQDGGPFFGNRKFFPPMTINAALLLLHRMFFTKAMLDHPSDPMQSKYAPSFLAAYRTSLSTVKLVRDHLKRYPHMLKRSWMVWKHAFTALIMLGTVVARGPGTVFAPPAFIELAMGMELLEQVAKEVKWASKYLAVLQPLRERAYEAYDRHRCGEVVSHGSEAQKEVERQISIFGGNTFSLSMGRKDSGSKSPSPPAPSVPQPLTPPSAPPPVANVQNLVAVPPLPLGHWLPPEDNKAQHLFGGVQIQSHFSTYVQHRDIFSNPGPILDAPVPPQINDIKIDEFNFDSLFQQSPFQTDVPDFAETMVFGSGDGNLGTGKQTEYMLMDQGWTEFMEELGL